jgi:hypothetical protein
MVNLFHIPFGNTSTLLSLIIEFDINRNNPTIKLNIKGNVNSNNYTYSIQNDVSRAFYDSKFHLLTLVKEDATFKLFLDNHLIPLIDFVDVVTPSYIPTTEANITLNSNDNSIFDTSLSNGSSITLNCRLNAFGILKSSLNISQIHNLFKYFEDIKFKLDPRYISLQNQIPDVTACPFSVNDVCKTDVCSTITDWSDFQQVVRNDDCFKSAVKHCASLDKNYNNEPICKMFDKDTLSEAASKSNGINDISLTAEDSSEDSDLLEQLRKIGLNNIHLDKSLRANGKYSVEINQLIDKIYQQKMMNTQGIQDSYDVDSSFPVMNEIKFDDLTEEKAKIIPGEIQATKENKSIDESIDESMSKSIKNELKKDANGMVNLNYEDIIDDFDRRSNTKTVNEDKKDMSLFQRLTSWL